jgi:hypothetical protein
MNRKVSGQIKYNNIEGGFWYLQVKDSNESFILLDMPEQLKYPDMYVTLVLQVFEDSLSLYMTGTPAKIISFETPEI